MQQAVEKAIVDYCDRNHVANIRLQVTTKTHKYNAISYHDGKGGKS